MGYRSTPGVAARSTTETFAALELRIENDRWRGVPFYVRAGKYLPVTQTEVRLVFRDRPPLRFLAGSNRPRANELVVRIDPATGIQVALEAHRADAGGPEPITLEMQFAEEGGEGPTPYETLFEAALAGDHSRFIRQDIVEESWRIVQPLLDAPPPVGATGAAAGGRPRPARCSHATIPGGSRGSRPAPADDQVGDEARPAGLVRGAEAGAGVGVEVLVEQQQVAPGRIVLQQRRVAEDRPPPAARRAGTARSAAR